MKRIMIFFLILAGTKGGIAIATNYYVNDNSTSGDIYCTAAGNSANDGLSAATPMDTLQDIISAYALVGGDTVFIDVGTYTWLGTSLVTVNTSDDGSAGNLVVFEGAGKSLVIINVTGSAVTFSGGAAYTKFENISVYATGGRPFYFSTGNNNIIYNCILERVTGSGETIQINGNSDGNEIAYCTITNSAPIASTGGQIIRMTGSTPDNNIIHHCKITGHGNSGNAIATIEVLGTGHQIYNDTIITNFSSNAGFRGVWLSSSATTSAMVYNNTIRGGYYGIYVTGAAGTALNHEIRNNFICGSSTVAGVYSNAGESVNLYFNSIYTANFGLTTSATTTSTKNWNIKNNIFYITSSTATDRCINIPTATSTDFPATCDCNLFYHPNGASCGYVNGTAYATLALLQGMDHEQTGSSGDGSSLEADPLYIDPSIYDLRLQSGSPALDGGCCIVGISDDILGIVRGGSCDIGAVESSTLLPVDLISFTGHYDQRQNSVSLSWITASEINNDYFSVERSLDGMHFENIQHVPGNGTSSSMHRYETADNTPLDGILYYRLAQTDYDGKKSYSAMVPVKIQKQELSVTINSISTANGKEWSFSVCTKKQGVIMSEVIDLSGRVTTVHGFTVSSIGCSEIKIDSERMARGIYFFRVSQNNNIVMQKFIK